VSQQYLNSLSPLFITGIGTDVGKTVVSAILAEALAADYWKPIQAGVADGTDSEWIDRMTSNRTTVHPELYKLQLAASPHIAARAENVQINIQKIVEQKKKIQQPNKPLLIEGAGGLLVPLNEKETILDLIKALDAKVILVSKNYLGSINHSLLTAQICQQHKLKVAGWIFNEQFMQYEDEIVQWTKLPKLASLPRLENMNPSSIQQIGQLIKDDLKKAL
jgi:dethiobiotin synthetase